MLKSFQFLSLSFNFMTSSMQPRKLFLVRRRSFPRDAHLIHSTQETFTVPWQPSVLPWSPAGVSTDLPGGKHGKAIGKPWKAYGKPIPVLVVTLSAEDVVTSFTVFWYLGLSLVTFNNELHTWTLPALLLTWLGCGLLGSIVVSFLASLG
jgi:hypothetical protein